MAQITPPDYSKIATRQQVYNVRPAQEQYRGPDENAGQVDLSTAKIIDSVVNGLDVFTRIYAQSEETADTLQANEILVKQANYNQSVKEAIKFNVGKTAPENLRMEEAVQKLRTINKDGKSDLYLGEGEGVNISSFPIPDDINDNVRSKIESSIVRGNIDIVNFLIDQVEDTQSKQIVTLLNNETEGFNQNYITSINSIPDKAKRREVLKPLLQKMNAKIDNLAFLGTWNPFRIKQEKDKVVQIALKAEFQRDRYLDSKDAIRQADEGFYKYTTEDGREVRLSRATITPYIEATIKGQNRTNQDFADMLDRNQIVDLINNLQKSQLDNPSKHINDWGVFNKATKAWEISDEKIDNSDILHRYMLSKLKNFTDKNGNVLQTTKAEQRKIKKELIYPSFIKAIKGHEAKLKEQEGEVVTESVFEGRYIPSVIKEWSARIVDLAVFAEAGEEKPKVRDTLRLDLNNKELNTQQLAKIATLDDYAETMATTASRAFELSPEQIKNEITRLGDKKYLDNNHRALRDVTMGILTARRKDLQTNIAYVQLNESSKHNQEILAGGKGEYNWEDVDVWQKKLGIVNNDKVIPESMFGRLELFKDKSLNHLDKMKLMNEYSALVHKFGDKYPQAHRQISKTLQRQEPELVDLFDNWNSYDTNRKIEMAKDFFIIPAKVK